MRDRRWSLLALPVLLAGCVSSGEVGQDPGGGDGGGGGGGIIDDDGGGGVIVTDPSFRPTRSSPGRGELSLSGELAGARSMLLHLDMDYPGEWGRPWELDVEMQVPAGAVEPVSFRAGASWPEGDKGAEAWLEGTPEDGRVQLRIRNRGSIKKGCKDDEPWSPSLVRLGTVTVRLLRSGQHPVALVRPGGDILTTCTGDRNPATYGGVIVVP